MGICEAGENAVSVVIDPEGTKVPAPVNGTDTAAAGFEDFSAKGAHDPPCDDESPRDAFATGFLKVGVVSEGSKDPVKVPTTCYGTFMVCH